METLDLAIADIIESVGIPTKERWVNILSDIPRHELGVLKVGGRLLEKGENLEQLSHEVAYLARNGLYMPIVVGSGNGDSASSIDKAIGNQSSIVEGLKRLGVEASAIDPSHTKAVSLHKPVDGKYDGSVSSVCTRPIIDAIYNGQVPVLSHLGRHDTMTLSCNPTEVAVRCAQYLHSMKLLISGESPVQNPATGEVVHKVYSEQHLRELVQEGMVSRDTAFICNLSYDLLKQLGPGHTVQIPLFKQQNGHMSSTGLLEELLGDGSGTMVMLPSTITQYPPYAVDQKELRGLIDQSFSLHGKRLAQDYFAKLPGNATVYLNSKKIGGAVSYPLPLPDYGRFEYICKLFTTPRFEGIGIASSLLETVRLQKDIFGLRASADNPRAVTLYTQYMENLGGFAERHGSYVYAGNSKENRREMIKAMSNLPATMEVII